MEKIFAMLNAEGAPIGFYSSMFHADIPKEAVEIPGADWQAFLGYPGHFIWDAAKGKRVDAPAMPASVPLEITPLQARNGLRLWGVGRAQIASFLAAIDDADSREQAEDAWEYATTIERTNPLIASCAAYLGKTAEEVDQFFRDSAAL